MIPAAKPLLGAGLLVLITLAAYAPSTRNGFIWDDDHYVEANETLRSAEGLRRIWFDLSATPQYYPLVHTSYWLEYRVWELDPAGYHLGNLVLHAMSAVLFWRVLRFLALPGAWWAAAIFALHPVHVESVAWITERKNVLSGVFYLASALTYLHWALGVSKRSLARRRGLYAASLLFFLCALLGKTVTASLPAALLLALWWKKGRLGGAEVRPLLPFFAFGLVLGLLTAWIEKYQVGAWGEPWELAFVERCLIAGRALWFYAGKLVWPVHLTFIYPRWEIDAQQGSQYVFPAAALAVVLALWGFRGRLGRGPLVAVLFFAGTLVPALGFFDVYPMRFSFVADHFQYLASLGLIALSVAAVARAIARRSGWVRGAALVASVFLLVTLGSLTWRQQSAYASKETLWRDTTAKNPSAWMAHFNLGLALASRDETDEAIRYYRRTLEIVPDFSKAHLNLGTELASKRRYKLATRHFRRAIELTPENPKPHYNLGIALGYQGQLDEAIREFREALRLQPGWSKARENLEVALRARTSRETKRAGDGAPGQKVVLVGIDGATFSVIDPLIAEGRLPTFRKFVRGGARGTLTPDPPLKSPPIWTSIVTGKHRSAHGIRDFFYRAPNGSELLIDSTRRQRSALWNWMSHFQRTVGFAGWWASWPAEEVNGWMITDRMARNHWSVWPGGNRDQKLTHPPELAETLEAYLVPLEDPPLEEFRRLGDFTEEELARLVSITTPIPYDRLSDLKFAYLAQRAYEDMALHMLERGQPDLTAVFLIANDPISHGYWHFYEPEKFDGVDSNELRRFGEIIPLFQEHLDRFLARLLSAIDPDSVVILVSDHGFEASGSLDFSGDHNEEGIFVAFGGPVRKGIEVEATIFDVAPTILRLLDLPVPEDLDGRVLEEILDPQFRKQFPARSIASLEPLYERAGRPLARTPGDAEMRELLRSLGYVD